MTTRPFRYEHDASVNASYFDFSDSEIARTVEIDEATFIDVDKYDMVVGLELLDGRQRDFDALDKEHHFPAGALDFVREILSAACEPGMRLSGVGDAAVTTRPFLQPA